MMIRKNICNNFEKEKKKDAKVASKETHKIFTDLIKNNNYKYINVSINNNNEGYATVASKVTHRSNKPGLHGLPGSNPGSGAPLTFHSKLNKISELR